MRRIHVTGASGSGTTTLGRALGRELGWRHLDSDDFFWTATDPPFQKKRAAAARAGELASALASSPSWVLSGSIMGWTGLAVPDFDLVVFLTLPTALRMARLQAREIERYGAEALVPGSDRHRESEDFLAWAAAYDDAETVGRNRAAHERWLGERTCPVLRLDSTNPVRDNVETVLARLQHTVDCS
jgi:adenylate kinase family enzyme